MILSDMESLRRKLDFLLLMHTEGSGKLNISNFFGFSIEYFHECAYNYIFQRLKVGR